jgi:hypothetical protein
MPDRRCVAVFTLAIGVLAGCRSAGSQGSIPAAAPAGAFRAMALAGVRFEPIGPTHMSDGLPTSGKVNAYAVDPANPRIIYVASGRGTALETYSSAGIYRTTNGGASWDAIDNGLTDSAGIISSVINDLLLVPNHSNVLLAASEYDGIYRSTNNGSSWNNVYRTAFATQLRSFGGVLYAATAAGILTSTDDGASWSVQSAANGSTRPTAFGVAQGAGGNALYAGLSNGSIYLLSGTRWTKTGQLPFNPDTGTDGSTAAVHQIAVDPLRPATVYASSNDGEWDQNLFASTDAGHTWKAVLKNKYYNLGLGTQAIAYSTVHPHRMFLGTDGSFYYMNGDGATQPATHYAANLSVIDIRDIWTVPNGKDDACWVASDQGLTYEPVCSTFTRAFHDHVVTSTVATGLARRFTVSPNGKIVLTSLQDFDHHITTDGGATWKQQVNQLYEDGFVELRPGAPATCYAYDEAYGLRVSINACVKFAPANRIQRKLFPTRLMTTPIAFDAQHPLTMYLLAAVDTTGYAAYTSTDGGATFSRLSWPVPNPGSIVVDPNNGAHIVVGGERSSGQGTSVWATLDGGASWRKATGVAPTAFWYALTISPANGNVVLVSSVDAANNVFVLRSRDGGRSFAKVATVTNAPLLRGRVEAPHALLRGGAAGSDDDADEDTDAGKRLPVYVYSPEREIRFNQDVTKGMPLVAITTLRGAYVSSDTGTTWRRLDSNLIAHGFWGIRWLNGYLYLASDGQGIVRSNQPLQTP